MKAIAVFPVTKEVRLTNLPEPSLRSPTEVLVRILEVGVCGTDHEICSFQYGTPPTGVPFLVLGHEALGQVIEVGSAVTRFRKGDLVVPIVRRPCPHASCVYCRSARQDFCVTGDFLERGIKGMHGFMTELIVEEEKFLVPVPAELRSLGVLVEPLTIAEKAFVQGADIQERVQWKGVRELTALVLGAGPVGLLGAMVFASKGLNTFAYSRDPEDGVKAAFLRSIGAKLVSAEKTTVGEMVKQIGGIDIVYEACGASKLAFDVLEHLNPNGAFCFTGVPGRRGPVPVDTDLLMRNMVLKNQVLFGTVNAGRDSYQAAVQDLAEFSRRWPDAMAQLITGRYPMADYEKVLLGRPGGIKNVISFQ